MYELTRVELLRDLYVWAYERSTQEYLALKQNLAEPDPLRLAWRDLIKQTIREIVLHPEDEPLASIQRSVTRDVPEHERPRVLARYGLRPSEYAAWKAAKAYPRGTKKIF